jgi:hypothetical protein
MGEGLRKVARLCGGLVVRAGGKTARYDGDAKRVRRCAKGGNCRWVGGEGGERCAKCSRPMRARRREK